MMQQTISTNSSIPDSKTISITDPIFFNEIRKNPEVDQAISSFEKLLNHWKIDLSLISIQKNGKVKLSNSTFRWGSERLLQDLLDSSDEPEEQQVLSDYLSSLTKMKEIHVFFNLNFSISFEMSMDISLQPRDVFLDQLLENVITNDNLDETVLSLYDFFLNAKEKRTFNFKTLFHSESSKYEFLGTELREKINKSSKPLLAFINNQLSEASQQVEECFIKNNIARRWTAG